MTAMTMRSQQLLRLGLLLSSVLAGGCFTKTGFIMPWTKEHDVLIRKLDSLEMRLDQLDASNEKALMNQRADLGNQLADVKERIGILSAKLDDYGGRLSRAAQRSARERRDTTLVVRPLHDDPAARYDQAYNDYTRGSYAVAAQGFADFLKAYAQGDLADNAQYWLGECYYSQKQFPAAQQEFQKVIDNYPDSDKVPAAMYKIGCCLENVGENAAAIEQYRLVRAKYPDSNEAKLAETALSRLLSPER